MTSASIFIFQFIVFIAVLTLVGHTVGAAV